MGVFPAIASARVSFFGGPAGPTWREEMGEREGNEMKGEVKKEGTERKAVRCCYANNETKPTRHHVNTYVCTHGGGGRRERPPVGLALAARVDRGIVDRWVSKKK